MPEAAAPWCGHRPGPLVPRPMRGEEAPLGGEEAARWWDQWVMGLDCRTVVISGWD